jgi:hypothetical protein
MYFETFKMIDGDIVIDEKTGDFLIENGQEELRQNIENRLSVNWNEWFLNIKLGLEYAAIQGKNISDEEIEYAIRECCYQDDRVREMKVNSIERNNYTRKVDIDITIIDKDENYIYMKEVVDVG